MAMQGSIIGAMTAMIAAAGFGHGNAREVKVNALMRPEAHRPARNLPKYVPRRFYGRAPIRKNGEKEMARRRLQMSRGLLQFAV